MIQNANINMMAKQNQSIDVGQLPMRLMSQQKNTNRKGNILASRGAKNAWASIDAGAEND